MLAELTLQLAAVLAQVESIESVASVDHLPEEESPGEPCNVAGCGVFDGDISPAFVRWKMSSAGICADRVQDRTDGNEMVK